MKASRVGLVYDERMTKHEKLTNKIHVEKSVHVENSARITGPYHLLNQLGISEKCSLVEGRLASSSELELVHCPAYIKEVYSYGVDAATDTNACKLPETWPSYVSPGTYEAASCAVGSTLNLVDQVCGDVVGRGLALVRPPGHHAMTDEACGFCFFNTVSIAAIYAQKQYTKIKKVLILDWDIHHGNGIQQTFYEDSSVLYISMHRYDSGEYFPGLKSASHEYVGAGQGEGFNVNIPWNKSIMGDTDYKCAFDKIVMPIASQFQPDLVLVAAGFDAIAADPLGDYILTDVIYAYMTSRLLTLAKGRVILALEGGYNVSAIGEALACCLRVMLGETTGEFSTSEEPCKKALQTVASVMSVQSEYWNFREPSDVTNSQ